MDINVLGKKDLLLKLPTSKGSGWLKLLVLITGCSCCIVRAVGHGQKESPFSTTSSSLDTVSDALTSHVLWGIPLKTHYRGGLRQGEIGSFPTRPTCQLTAHLSNHQRQLARAAADCTTVTFIWKVGEKEGVKEGGRLSHII